MSNPRNTGHKIVGFKFGGDSGVTLALMRPQFQLDLKRLLKHVVIYGPNSILVVLVRRKGSVY